MRKNTKIMIGSGVAVIGLSSLLFFQHKSNTPISNQAITTSTTTSMETTRSKAVTPETSIATNFQATSTDESMDTPTGHTLTVNGKVFKAELADTQELQEHGLSDRLSLPQDRVMVFAFDRAWPWEIWMKDMKFSIDIFWLDQNMKVIYKKENISPDTYPQTFAPKQVAWYVVEANAGFAAQNKVKVGSIFKLSNQ